MTILNNQQKSYINHLAQEILKENIYNEGKDHGYTAASGKMLVEGATEKKWLYPFQWLWDTFFICAWSNNTKQSIIDAKKFLAAQQENGFFGHIRYNREILDRKDYFPPPDIYYIDGIPKSGEVISKITQPPNIGFGLLELTKKLLKQNEDISSIKSMFYSAYKYHQYIYKYRMYENCMVTIHPWEAGDDNSPKWDAIYDNIEKTIKNKSELKKIIDNWLNDINLKFERVDLKIVKHTQRPIDPHYYMYLYLINLYGQWDWDDKKIIKDSPFRVLDPMTNAILLKSDTSLLELAQILNVADKEIIEEIKNWIETSTVGIEGLWSEENESYFAKDLTTNALIKIDTVSCLLPIFSGKIKQERASIIAKRIESMIQNKNINFVIPSTSIKETLHFEPDRYWRGPVWIITNELISIGLDFYGYKDIANKIRENSLNLILNTLDNNGGFYEYYNPITGKGLGSAKQSWTAAAVHNAIKNIDKVCVSDKIFANIPIYDVRAI